MFIIKLFFFLIYFLIYNYCKLIYVVEVNRHGARTSTNYPNGKLSKFFGIDDKLTPNGLIQQQKLGKIIRNKYINELKFLSKNYNPSEFEIFSTEYQRTIFSAEGFLSGLYPGYITKIIYKNKELKDIINNDSAPIAEGYFNENFPKEINLNVIDGTKDKMFHPNHCKLNNVLFEDYFNNNNKIFNISNKEIEKNLDEITNFLDVKIKNDSFYNPQFKLEQISKIFFVYTYHFGKNINSLSKEAKNLIKKTIINKYYSILFYNEKAVKIKGSDFFNNLLKIFDNAINKQKFLKTENNKKFTVFSAHDSNIINCISNLLNKDYIKELINKSLKNDEIFNFLVPTFASNLIFELHKEDNKKYYVKIYLNGKIIDKKLINGIHGDKEGKIIYEDFKKLIKDRIDNDYKKLKCSKKKLEKEDINIFE